MCGIVGFVNKDGATADRSILEAMNLAIVHRGPDEDGFYLHENVGLAMRRLAIIDLAGGHQPIHNHDRSKWIVFNGEIYNYQELRAKLEAQGHIFYTNSDTEVIIHLYDRYGADCVTHLRGMFAFAIWDERERELFAARDRVGKKPLLYSHQSNGDLIFASEFMAMLKHPAVSRDVDNDAINAYLSYLCVPAPMTAFRQIRKLEPGHWMKWRGGAIEIKRYWLPDLSKKISISEEEAIEETTRQLQEATRLRMISEVPLGAFLSGGVDSSIVAALMARESSRPVKTFSIGFEEQDFSELKYARRVAEHIGAEYNEFIVKPDALEVLPTLVEHYGEPYADSSAVPTYYVARETRKHVTVALNGDGGDESFAGYERYAAMQIADALGKFPGNLLRAAMGITAALVPTSEIKRSRVRDLKRFLKAARLPRNERYFRWNSTFYRDAKSELLTDEFKNSLGAADPSTVIEKWFDEGKHLGGLDAALLTDIMTYLPNDLLVKVDIATMANSLEGRSPFLDHHVIEFAASLPESLKMWRLKPKYLLKKVAARLVPPEVVYRRKVGFGMPIAHWMRTDLRNLLKDVLLGSSFKTRGVCDHSRVARLVEEHLTSERDNSWELWTLLMLELWYQRFIDQ